MVRKLLFLICAILCGCMTMPTFIDIDNKGLFLNTYVKDSCYKMKDSVMFSFTLTNPQNDTIKIDRIITVYLGHRVNTFVFFDTHERIAYKIFRDSCDTIILPKEKRVLNVMVCLKPEFFYDGKNEIIAHVLCADFYDEERKEVIRAKNKISVYSNPFCLKIGRDSSQGEAAQVPSAP